MNTGRLKSRASVVGNKSYQNEFSSPKLSQGQIDQFFAYARVASRITDTVVLCLTDEWLPVSEIFKRGKSHRPDTRWSPAAMGKWLKRAFVAHKCECIAKSTNGKISGLKWHYRRLQATRSDEGLKFVISENLTFVVSDSISEK